MAGRRKVITAECLVRRACEIDQRVVGNQRRSARYLPNSDEVGPIDAQLADQVAAHFRDAHAQVHLQAGRDGHAVVQCLSGRQIATHDLHRAIRVGGRLYFSADRETVQRGLDMDCCAGECLCDSCLCLDRQRKLEGRTITCTARWPCRSHSSAATVVRPGETPNMNRLVALAGRTSAIFGSAANTLAAPVVNCSTRPLPASIEITLCAAGLACVATGDVPATDVFVCSVAGAARAT